MEFLRTIIDGLNIPNFSLPNVDIRTVIEILIMTYFIYKLVQWVKRTTAMALFRGLVVVVVVFMLAYMLELYTLTWMMSYVFSAGLVAAVVIFQPELRAALEKLGKNNYVRFVVPEQKEQDNVLTERSARILISSLFKMSSVRTGAFIVIENSVNLSAYGQTGTKLDADLSEPLLLNIFEDKTPLHDGAVIIQQNRIAAASCIMPLTQTEIGAEYGTRHRAAVGTSEVSDAYVIVVSEETGKVSVAREGKLYPGQTPETLEKLLLGHGSPKGRLGKRKGRAAGEKNT